MTENTEGKIDRRTKEYKDSQKSVMTEIEQPTSSDEVAELKDTVKTLTEMVQTMGKITANTAKEVKDVKKTGGKKVPIVSKIKYPRYDEFLVLSKFVNDNSYLISDRKDACYAIGLFVLEHSTENLLHAVSKVPELRKKALEENITKDFKTVIVPKKESK